MTRKKEHTRKKNSRHSIPKTSAAAKKMGLSSIKMSLDQLSDNELKDWLIFERTSTKSRSPCGVIPLSDGTYKICFLDPNTGLCDDCYQSDSP